MKFSLWVLTYLFIGSTQITAATVKALPSPKPIPCVPGYKMGDNPGSGCCYEYEAKNGVTCTESTSTPPPTLVIVCTGSDGSSTTFTTKKESGGSDPTTWKCSTNTVIKDAPKKKEQGYGGGESY